MLNIPGRITYKEHVLCSKHLTRNAYQRPASLNGNLEKGWGLREEGQSRSSGSSSCGLKEHKGSRSAILPPTQKSAGCPENRKCPQANNGPFSTPGLIPMRQLEPIHTQVNLPRTRAPPAIKPQSPRIATPGLDPPALGSPSLPPFRRILRRVGDHAADHTFALAGSVPIGKTRSSLGGTHG